jgi:DNA repair exonuclease SbcCD ATPase subunit
MKLQRLTLENFRGIKSRTFEFNGKSANVRGKNASGKTTLANAYSYLLTDKAYTGEASFDPKTTGSTKLNHVVEAEFEKENGAKVTLKKDFHEVWTKKRGSQTETFSGHETSYYIDGVPTKAKDFQAEVETLFGDQAEIQSLTNPSYFAEVLPWKDRREILIDITGSIDDAEILKNLPELEEALKKDGSDERYTVEDLQAIHTEKKRKINRELESIPARIDEVERSKYEEPSISRKNLEVAIKQNEKEIDRLTKQLSSEDTVQSEAEKEILETINNLEKDLLQAKQAETKARYEVQSRIQGIADRLRDEALKARADLRFQQDHKENIEQNLRKFAEMRKKLADEYTAINREEYQGDDICPTCGQELPEEMKASSRETWNQSKSQRLENLLSQMRQYSKDKLQKLEASQSKNLEELKAAEGMLQRKEESYQNAIKNLSETENMDTPERQAVLDLQLKLEKAKADYMKIQGNPDSSQSAKTEIEERITKLKSETSTLEQYRMQYEANDKAEARKKELEDEHKALAKAYETSERIVALTEEFTARKAKAITEHVNQYFKTVSFSLFSEQINGGIKEECEVLIPDGKGALNPWRSANTAGKINAGLEIIEALSKHYGKSIPIFIDGAESVTSYIKIPNQIIKLTVDETAEELTMEKE